MGTVAVVGGKRAVFVVRARVRRHVATFAHTGVLFLDELAQFSLITAADGLALGREVYAVPGPLGSAASAGANELIASGRVVRLPDGRLART